MLRFLLGCLGVSTDEFTLTATEAAVAAMLLRGLVLPLLQKARAWRGLSKPLQTLALAVIAGLGAALDHFAGGNETQSSVLTGVAAFIGALGLQQGEKTLKKRRKRHDSQRRDSQGLQQPPGDSD
jgi:hypothetical protein